MDKKELIKQRLKERTASKRYKLSEGENTFRVLPNKLGEEHLDFFEYGMHSNVGPNNRYLRCGKSRSGKGDCWLCEKNAVLVESKKASHRAAGEKMVRVDKFATQISPIIDGSWLPPTLFEMPASVANGLLGIMHRKAVTDLKKGYNLTIERSGTTFKGTKYGSLIVDDEPSKVPSKIVEAMKTFGELVPKYSEAKQKEGYYGQEQEEDGEEEEEVKPRKPGKKPVDEEDEVESEVEEETEEEEEEVKPKKPRKPAAEDDEEPEEADEEDSEYPDLEDEDEGPKKPKKPKKPVDEDEDEIPEEEEEEPEEEEEEEKVVSIKKTGKKKKPVVEEEEDE